MGFDLIVSDLSLDLKPSFIPKSISDFLDELTIIDSISERIRRIDDFVGRLEDEMRKIEAFKRELPLCVLVTNDALKEELAKYRKRNAEPILQEFIPLKKQRADDEKDKMKWMSSFQLGSTNDSKNTETDSDFNDKEETVPNLVKAKEVSSPRIGFRDFNSSAPDSQSSLRVVPHQQSGRKQRRCWSTELHQLFIDALEKLGGSQVATPKQIKDLMQVDGLTNDEVKSHLQKYRLHSRRVPTSTVTSSSNQSSIDLGGLWLQKDQCGNSYKEC